MSDQTLRETQFDYLFQNDGNATLTVPGFMLPIDYAPFDGLYPERKNNRFSVDTRLIRFRFRHGTGDFRPDRPVAKELAMLCLMNSVTEARDWDILIFDDHLVAALKRQATGFRLISDAAFDWCITELRDKVRTFQDVGFVAVFDTESLCIKSDILIDIILLEDLINAVQPLVEDLVEDWLPYSEDQVMNLVDPSLFPLVYGRTHVLDQGMVSLSDGFKLIGQGITILRGQHIQPSGGFVSNRMRHDQMPINTSKHWSKCFQWLPCEVKFKGNQGTEVEITSYINNLHPIQHKDLYSVIEKIISKSIQPWNEVLIKGEWGRYPKRIRVHGVEVDPPFPGWADHLPRSWNDVSGEDVDRIFQYLELPNNPNFTGESTLPSPGEWSHDPIRWNPYQIVRSKWEMIRQIIEPEPGQAYTYEQWRRGNVNNAIKADVHNARHLYNDHTFYRINLEHTFRDRGLQVIVKIAGIELTPDRPKYRGSDWHLEGMLNEHIVATSIFYYDVENTTESFIHFRQEDQIERARRMKADDIHDLLSEVYDSIRLSDGGVSYLGAIPTPRGRLLVFPNTLQHAVQEFELADPTEAGHRRYLVLWLVDPHYRIMSTANVPPQQHSWWAPEAARAACPDKVPDEIVRMIANHLPEFPMSWDEAEAYEEMIIAERKTFDSELRHPNYFSELGP